MEQPELGIRLTALRKEKNLTQEELVEKSNVSVRTIQRIEAGEVMPRVSTIKILLQALGENYETFSTKLSQSMETKNTLPGVNRNTLLTAALAGIVYLVTEIILSTLDVSWFTGERNWGIAMNSFYAGLTVTMVISYALFIRGFITLSAIFENRLLRSVCVLLVIATTAFGMLDIFSLITDDVETLLPAYIAAALVFGALSIAFGISLIRLQDGMGEMARIAGLLEIVMGCLLATVLLFFISYVIMVPAVVIEILVLYRGYEYLSRTHVKTVSN